MYGLFIRTTAIQEKGHPFPSGHFSFYKSWLLTLHMIRFKICMSFRPFIPLLSQHKATRQGILAFDNSLLFLSLLKHPSSDLSNHFLLNPVETVIGKSLARVTPAHPTPECQQLASGSIGEFVHQ